MAGQIIFEEGDAPASPAASNLALYAKANNILYTKDSSGTETEVSITFASSAENAAGTVQNKAVDPLGIREAFNATGSAPVYACRAWVNFNGTGTVAIRASGNVSSITDNGTGDYTVNFTTAMPDVNYSASTGIRFDETGGGGTGIMLDLSRTAQTISTLRVRANTWNGTFYDCSTVSINVFR